MSGMWSAVAVFCGGGIGCLTRWGLGALLNPIFPTIPLGTVAVNLIGGMLIGLASAFFSHNAGMPPELRLMVITGFLGGLTTFSTFSLDTAAIWERGQSLTAVLYAATSVVLSIGALFAGLAIVRALVATAQG